MFWVHSRDGDETAFAMFRRHYSAKKNKKPKIRQFVGPGQKMVLVGWFCAALFVWRKFIDDSGQNGVNCAVFRNESPHLSSDMIIEAMHLAWERWPGERLYTTVDPRKVKSQNPGYCFICAGWRRCGTTKGGLFIFEFVPTLSEELPEPTPVALISTP
jgi:hypothetical protein